ncbi:MAG: hypothetical protein PWQ91_1139 [Eubacteriales bacterium]|nr:hypothetical protein [Eubacteriales bacterium]MDN5364078.1 hypothetical protein [Eubacteriales bacterium]
MATVVPFRGVRYNLEKAGNLADLVTPPYDVIDAEGQKMYHEKSPYNVIRLELGYKYPDDSEENNRYTRARDTFRRWLAEGILRHDPRPAIYLYQQEFDARGERKVRTGFIAGVKVEDYSKGVVLPHEETLPKHKADRLELMRHCLANFSPIFGLYSDPDHAVDSLLEQAKGGRAPDMEVTDENGIVNRLWVIDDPEVVARVVAMMADKKIYIADGHHRYETALAFSKEMEAKGQPGYDYIMMTLVNLYDRGLVVFPTHRLVYNLTNFNLDALVANLQENFMVEELPAGTELPEVLRRLEEAGRQTAAFAMYAGGGRYFLLTLKDRAVMKDLVPDRSEAWRNLDVTILHTLILEKYLGIGSQQRAEESNLVYTRDEEFAVREVDKGNFQLAFLMNPTRVEEVTAVAEGGEKMPQKSTFFYPKVITGLVINDFTR